MKKIFRIVFIVFILFSVRIVYAEDYKIKELIPRKVKTTVHTDNFNYIGITSDNKGINFEGILNLTDRKLPVSISIGLFNKNGINIGTINYCDSILDAHTEMNFSIYYKKSYFGKNYGPKDIKYISVLNDNITCKKKGSLDYIGLKVDRIGVSNKNSIMDNALKIFLYILGVLGLLVLIYIIYKFMFTKSYKNFDGNLIRKAYQNNVKKEDIEILNMDDDDFLLEKDNVDKDNSVEISDEDESTDLHNLYK